MAQIEDAAVLSQLLSNVKMPSQLANALEGYMEIRKSRCGHIGEISRQNGIMFHLPDGPEQIERDSRLANIGNGDRQDHREQFAYDVHVEVQKWLAKNPLI
jgi:hypothetical protein